MKKPTRFFHSLIAFALPLAVAIYCVWYWSSNHWQLAAWYKKLHPYFYKSETWEASYFTENVKVAGNWWCLAALLAAIIWVGIFWKTRAPNLPEITLKKRPVFIYASIAVAAILLFLVANFSSEYHATDEVFSALNFAALPTFQTISYYPLPNNHILFNALNGSLFWVEDMVQSGRIISMICYMATLCFTWFFLQKYGTAAWLRGLILLVLALQFPAWGFSAQARGYELLLLLSCLSLGTFCAYFGREKKPPVDGNNLSESFKLSERWVLALHLACNVAGILTLPSYIYWWLGLLLAAIVIQIINRQFDKSYLQISIAGFAASFIFYLPLLSFSGLASLAENRYVQPEKTSAWHFLTHINERNYFNGLFSEWFCTDNSSPVLGAVCLLLSLILLVFPKEDRRRWVLGIACFSMLFAFLAMAVFMLKLPFYRNLIAHGYLALLAGLIAVAPFFRLKIMQAIFALSLLIFAGYTGWKNYHRMPDYLYYYGVGAYFQQISQCDIEFEPGSTVFLDDECFYWHYVLQKKYPAHGLKIEWNKGRFNEQDYCVMPLDSLPPGEAGVYKSVKVCAEHQVFQKWN